MIKNKVKSFIKKYNLTGTFIVAFSGGYDSMCLLDILYKLGHDIIAVHLNHNWRGEESQKEQENCKKFAQANNIKYYTETLPDYIEKTETSARKARYDFFQRCAKKFNSNVIFTAHNFDDNAETILYRITKGTGTIGLQGIAENRDIFYRPLLTTTRAEIEKYIKTNHLIPNNDSSNSNQKYKRNFIRHKILPLLEEINPNVKDALNSLSNIAKEDNEIINSNLPADILTAKPIEQKRIIYNILTEHNIDYDKNKIENIQKFIEENKTSKSGKTISLTTDLWLFVSNNKTEVISKTQQKDEQIAITHCGTYKFGNYEFSITPYTKILEKFPSDSEYKAYINIDKIDFILRHRQAGDRIHPLGATGSQKLKKYLNEKKIPAHQKDELVLLTNKNEVLWVAGYGINDKIKIKNKPTHLISLNKYKKG